MGKLLTFTDRGLYCPRADVYIDPTRVVDNAIITHAHSDHARRGHRRYLAHRDSAVLLRHRLGSDITLRTVDYGEPIVINGVRFSLHSAGHIYGSAQVRVEYGGEVWVASGDYKTEDDGISTPFELVRCTTFITECTFGLPIYRWMPQQVIAAEVNEWWRRNAEAGKASIAIGYSLGKAQRIAGFADSSIGPIYAHSAVWHVHEAMLADGAGLPPVHHATPDIPGDKFRGALVIMPPSALGTAWLKQFEPYSTGYFSGWMVIRSARGPRTFDRGFALSDHADWPSLNTVVRETGAECVYATHGFTAVFARWLSEQGLDARAVTAHFRDEPEQQSEMRKKEEQ